MRDAGVGEQSLQLREPRGTEIAREILERHWEHGVDRDVALECSAGDEHVGSFRHADHHTDRRARR